MKILLISFLLNMGVTLAHAEATTPSTLRIDTSRAVRLSMTPEQQAAARATGITLAQEKQAAWGSLSQEDKSSRQAAAMDKLQPYRNAMQTQMQESLSPRPFGRR